MQRQAAKPIFDAATSAALRRGVPAMQAMGAHMARMAATSSRTVPRTGLASVGSMSTRGFSSTPEWMLPSDTFTPRHIGPSPKEAQEMCDFIGVKDVDQLMTEAIPSQVRRDTKLDLPPTDKLGEKGALELLKSMVSKNVVASNFIGMGYHGTITPQVIMRNLTENPAWYTAYTPYQAEISQGRMESLVNFQTLVCELTGMEVANASLLDEATAAAEAMAMVARTVNAKVKNKFFISQSCHPQTIEVMQTRAPYLGIELIVGDHHTTDFASMKDLMGALVQYPDTTGKVEDFTAIGEALHANGAHFVVAADPLSLCSLKPPGEFGADVVVGSMQRFGVPMWFGGPSAAYMATSTKQVRRMPGRIIGESIDRLGNPGYRLTLQTREQHIRLDKATSNLCTAQVLLANMSAMYAVWHRPDGLKAIAKRVTGMAQTFANELAKVGVAIKTDAFFDTVAFETADAPSMVKKLQAQGINLRAVDAKTVTASFDETHTTEDVLKMVDALKAAGLQGSGSLPAVTIDGKAPAGFERTSAFLEQKIFNSIHSETEMMRYIRSLENKDLSLVHSMISLGSCTMKLNSVSSLAPCSWPEVANMHPFAPPEQTKGYMELLESLEQYLITSTGFEACSLQPTSGASGEYAGLLVIKKYLESIGQGHRNICIIPKSAHGTNPASASMVGMKIVWIDDSKGIDMAEFTALCEKHKDDLAALMVTYPSTRAFFEENIQPICETVHQNGGQVYMDGANMNAQLGLTSPGMIGADVCHLNTHKTFSIPHGGGGPGQGPICMRKHLAPFMPSHSVQAPKTGGELGAVSAAPYGQAGIAAIPWMFTTMLGVEGLTDCARYSILNANYMRKRLEGHYKMAVANPRGRCAHEFIIDCSDIRADSGIVEEDIAKRLMDYGFHAPTMSWPVPHSLMVEPTESEDKAELDRFCDAMISIREEIKKVADGTWPLDDNPLKNAPHTQSEVCGDSWTHPYSRQEAAFPAEWTLKRGKFWPTNARVDNSLGDRKLKLRHTN